MCLVNPRLPIVYRPKATQVIASPANAVTKLVLAVEATKKGLLSYPLFRLFICTTGITLNVWLEKLIGYVMVVLLLVSANPIVYLPTTIYLKLPYEILIAEVFMLIILLS